MFAIFIILCCTSTATYTENRRIKVAFKKPATLLHELIIRQSINTMSGYYYRVLDIFFRNRRLIRLVME